MKTSGFTLAELLMVISILAVIATYSIPKILVVQQNGRLNAITKEAVSMVSNAYHLHKLNGQSSAMTQANQLTPYLNYVKLETSNDDNCGTDSPMGVVTITPCGTAYGVGYAMVRLHNGALLELRSGHFMGTSASHAVHMVLDADGKATGNGDSVGLVLYHNGRITTFENCSEIANLPGVCPLANADPDWLNW